MAGVRLRPYSGKIRTRSFRLFWVSFALMAAAALGLEAFSAWSLVGDKIIRATFLVLVFVIAGSGWAYMGCVLYDWWAWFCNTTR